MRERSPDTYTRHSADLAACRELLANGSRTFLAASYMLPPRLRDPATALYAFCRIADDAIDTGHGSPEAVADLMLRLDHAYGGDPRSHPADRAFAETVHRFSIPKSIPAALIDGFAWDAEGRRYETIEDLHAYASRVAGTVGAMMALLMEARDPTQLARATDLGIAMQLTNIARDVGEDARAGRIYLPLSWMREAGLEPERWLRDPTMSPRLASVIERLLCEADRLYASSAAGIAKLPSNCRPGIFAARYIYAEIGHELRRQGLDSITRRAIVPGRRKVQLAARSLNAALASMVRPVAQQGPAVVAAQFLIEAVLQEQVWPSARGSRPWWNVYGGFVNAIELFERLETSDRHRHAERRRREPVPSAAASGG